MLVQLSSLAPTGINFWQIRLKLSLLQYTACNCFLFIAHSLKGPDVGSGQKPGCRGAGLVYRRGSNTVVGENGNIEKMMGSYM
jgi:hypothetical protein